MKKYLSTALTVVFVVTILAVGASGVLAQDDDSTAIENPIKTPKIAELLTRIIDVLLIIAIPAFVVILAFAAYHLVISQGDPQKKRLAASLLKYGFIGFIIIVFAKAIVAIIFSFFD